MNLQQTDWKKNTTMWKANNQSWQATEGNFAILPFFIVQLNSGAETVGHCSLFLSSPKN